MKKRWLLLTVFLVLGMMIQYGAVADEEIQLPEGVYQVEDPEWHFYVLLPEISLREQPRKSGKVITKLHAGDQIIPLRDDGEWYLVKDINSNIGWVETSFVNYGYKIFITAKGVQKMYKDEYGSASDLGAVAADITKEIVIVTAEYPHTFEGVTLKGRYGHMSRDIPRWYLGELYQPDYD